MAPKVILATGGSGYIGSHCVLELLNAGYEVVAVDNFKNSKENGQKSISLQRVEEISGKTATFYACDITNKEEVDRIFRQHKIFGVIHFAALKSIRESLEIPLEYYRNNLVGCLVLLQCMKDHNVKNFVFSSSFTVYGTPKKLPVTEDDSDGTGLMSPYGHTKYIMEQILRDLCKAEPDWNVISLRYFNPVGAHSSGLIGEDPKGVPKQLMPYISLVLLGKLPFVPIYGNDYDTPDGTGVRDFIHVVDLAEGHVTAMKKIEEGQTGLKVYNLGTGQGHSVMQVIAAMERASGKTIPIEVTPRKEGDLGAIWCDVSKANKELGWKAKFGLDDWCRHTWNWLVKNPNGFE